MSRLGHTIVRERPDQIVYQDKDTGSYMTIVFNNGEILPTHLAENLRNEGINPDMFFAELESM